jgi:hypothetical protein
MEPDQASSYTPALRHPGHGQVLSEPQIISLEDSETEGVKTTGNSSGILSGGRPVRLVVYDRKQTDHTRIICMSAVQ